MRGTKNIRKKKLRKKDINCVDAVYADKTVTLCQFESPHIFSRLYSGSDSIFASSAHPFSIDVFILSLVPVGFSLRARIRERPARILRM